jgi:hypothetical protein
METQTDTNKQGFPIQECTRCGTSGKHSYNDIHGETCMKCAGVGFVIVRKALPAWNAYRKALRQSKECRAIELVIGDHVAIDGEWRQVEAMAVTPEIRGWATVFEHTSAIGTKVPTDYAMLLTIGGEIHNANTSTVYRRKAKSVDPAPYLAMIPKSRTKK